MVEALKSVKSRLAASRVECANFRWDAQAVINNTRNVEKDIAALIAEVSKELICSTNRHVAIVKKELDYSLKCVSTHIEMESKGALSRMRAELERYDSSALRAVAASRAVLQNRMSVLCCDLP